MRPAPQPAYALAGLLASRRAQPAPFYDAGGRLVAASTRGGRLFNAESVWFKALSAPEGAARAYVGEPFRPAGSLVALFEIAVPVRDASGGFLGAVRAACASHF